MHQPHHILRATTLFYGQERLEFQVLQLGTCPNVLLNKASMYHRYVCQGEGPFKTQLDELDQQAIWKFVFCLEKQTEDCSQRIAESI